MVRLPARAWLVRKKKQLTLAATAGILVLSLLLLMFLSAPKIANKDEPRSLRIEQARFCLSFVGWAMEDYRTDHQTYIPRLSDDLHELDEYLGKHMSSASGVISWFEGGATGRGSNRPSIPTNVLSATHYEIFAAPIGEPTYILRVTPIEFVHRYKNGNWVPMIGSRQ